MLEKNALTAVVEFLRPEHFYSDAHSLIYGAIIDLFKASDPVDMRTVVSQLRKNGKLDLVGGAYAIAELTSKVSSAANIEYHSRIIIEMGAQRGLDSHGMPSPPKKRMRSLIGPLVSKKRVMPK